MIIALTGTNGAGKNTIADYLVREHGFTHFSFRTFLTEEIIRRGLPVTRESMRTVGNDLRFNHEQGYISKQILGDVLTNGTNAVIESIRSMDEAHFLLNHGARFWAVDAPERMRYERIINRHDKTDQISFETFKAQEEKEYKNKDPKDMSVREVMQLAEITFLNAGTPQALFDQIEQALHGT